MKTIFHQLSLISASILTLWAIAHNRLIAKEVKIPAQQQLAQNATSQYSFDDYKRECLQRATREGLPRAEAESVCNCTINQFRARYSIQAFRALVQKSKNNTTAARTLSAVGESCFEEILYEE